MEVKMKPKFVLNLINPFVLETASQKAIVLDESYYITDQLKDDDILNISISRPILRQLKQGRAICIGKDYKVSAFLHLKDLTGIPYIDVTTGEVKYRGFLENQIPLITMDTFTMMESMDSGSTAIDVSVQDSRK